MNISFHIMKGLGRKKQSQIVYMERNNYNYTHSAAHMYKNIDYTYSVTSLKVN